ncbi:MAG: hypothetical protein PHC51_11820 [bacterium]|nr:hypothetical protein [bacterium]
MALTGFLVNQGHSTICAPDSAAAIVAIGGMPQIVGGGEPYLCDYMSVNFVAPNIFYTLIGCRSLVTTKEYSSVHPQHLARCDPAVSTDAYMDGMTIGWGVVSAMAAAASIIFLKKAFFR